MFPRCSVVLAFPCVFLSIVCHAVPAPDALRPHETISSGTILHVQVDSDAPMKRGAVIEAHIVEPVFVDNQLTIPAGSQITGTVEDVVPTESKKRNEARMQGDFTPLHKARIRFSEVTLPDGTLLTMTTAMADEGVQMVRIQSLDAAMNRPSLPKRMWSKVQEAKSNTVHTITAPGKGNRLKKFVYHQLPYHPEAVDAGLEYDVRLTAPLEVPVSQSAEKPVALEKKTPGLESFATIHAMLQNELSSKDAKSGMPVTAVVTQPLFDKNNRLAVPQGATLSGAVTEAQPAGKWGRGGVLRFAFREITFPAGFRQDIHGAPGAIATNGQSNLHMDAEGGVTARRPSSVTPLVTGLLATWALTEDESSAFHSGVASNGFALVGRIVGITAGSNYVGAAIGMFTTGRMVYTRFIHHGADVTFPRNTRIEIQVDPVRSPALRPE
jgi:hypothetical protein